MPPVISSDNEMGMEPRPGAAGAPPAGKSRSVFTPKFSSHPRCESRRKPEQEGSAGEVIPRGSIPPGAHPVPGILIIFNPKGREWGSAEPPGMEEELWGWMMDG